MKTKRTKRKNKYTELRGAIADGIVKSGIGMIGLVVVAFSTVTTTFLDAYSAGESAKPLFARAAADRRDGLCAWRRAGRLRGDGSLHRLPLSHIIRLRADGDGSAGGSVSDSPRTCPVESHRLAVRRSCLPDRGFLANRSIADGHRRDGPFDGSAGAEKVRRPTCRRRACPSKRCQTR